MLAFISRRLILAFFTIWVISLLAFAIIQLPPGDMVDKYLEALMEGSYFIGNISAGAAPLEETHKEAQYLREYYGLDQPFYVRYGKWVWNMRKLDFGYSYLRRGTSNSQQTKVTEIIQDRLWMTLILTAATVVCSYHYPIDSLIGAITGWFCYIYIPRIHDYINSK